MKQYNKGNDRNKGFQGRNGRSDRRRDIRDTPLNRMEETILATMRSEEIHDWSARQLLKKTGVLDKLAFYDALRSLKDRRMILLDREHNAKLIPVGEDVEATLISLSKNFGFARPDSGGDDIFIHGSALQGALVGDRIIVGDIRKDDRGPSGRVRRIVEHKPAQTTGTVSITDEGIEFIPDNAIRYNLRMRERDLNGAKNGDKVMASLEQDYRGDWAYASVKKVFGSGRTARVCADAIVEQYGIPHVFPQEVLDEAERVGNEPISDEEYAKRLDLRGEPIFTIDSKDAKDLDDAISVKRTDFGYTLGVHIADVSHYVKEGSAIDEEAINRGTSVYFADRVIPMLPEVLSNGACSLNAGTDKLAFSALIELDKEGHITKYDFKKTIINSKVRGVYSEVNEILDGTASEEILNKYAPVMESLMSAKELADILKANSAARGTMELDSGESKFILDENGICIDIMPRVSGEAEQLIEQMMVTANIAAAKFSLDHKLPFLYRVHGTPDPKRVEELVTLLQLVGVPCKEIVKPNPETQDFAAILDRVRGLPCETLVSQRLLRTMEKARYSTEETGHFGLALSDYSHYTSPIRRYPDTSIHRVLSAFVEGMPAEEVRRRYAQFCETSATESSRNEIRALIAERDAEDCYMAEYMSQHIGEHFEGTVSGVTMRGVFVRLENSVEGFVSLDAFEGEDFVYDGLITQRSPKRELTIGTPLPIIVASAYVATGKVDFVPDKEKLDI
ncbi:ribonuclease R [Ruminococcus bromii]|uniref:ribonuclease R n=1 Tax=Ruminococcus bromii TaxID=40518 RepID=UPI00292D361A|nr:ribonuclease R [Ruminococcus bromii]MDD6330154.1 ribonuclease R [Bacillota bacterium]MDE8727978.1 ribonuclease R [Ruminococcus bromii]MDY4937663.1 ribonuclease R [Oscillospiraceae bacterium]